MARHQVTSTGDGDPSEAGRSHERANLICFIAHAFNVPITQVPEIVID